MSYEIKGKKPIKIALAPMEGETNIKKAKKKMLSYIKEAAKGKADMVLFSELALNGKGESAKGKTVKEFAKQAKKNNMYIIFGMKEEKVVNIIMPPW